MALVSPQQVSDGTSIVASNVNNPINTIANDYNGNITDANISASAAISGSKLATASVPTTTLINDWQTNYVVSGGVVAISSGLIGTCTNVVVVIDGYKMTLSSIANKTYTASKDTYVDVLRTGTTPSIVYTEVANAAASPALASSSLRLAKVVTSGAAITSITQSTNADSLGNIIRNTGAVSTTLVNNPYKFRVHRSSSQGGYLVTADTYYKVQYDTKDYDTGSNYDNATNYRFTAPIAGFYHLNAYATINNGANTLNYAIALYKNGSIYKRSAGVSNGGALGDSVLYITDTAQLAATDYIEVFVRCNVNGIGLDGDSTTSGATNFSGFLVSAN